MMLTLREARGSSRNRNRARYALTKNRASNVAPQSCLLPSFASWNQPTHQTSSGPATPRACRLVGAFGSKYGFSASAVTLVPCLGSDPP
jgi:hypothetical protein